MEIFWRVTVHSFFIAKFREIFGSEKMLKTNVSVSSDVEIFGIYWKNTISLMKVEAKLRKKSLRKLFNQTEGAFE